MRTTVAILTGLAVVGAWFNSQAATVSPKPPAKPAGAAKSAPPKKAAVKAAPRPRLVAADGTITREGLATIAFSAAGREKDRFNNKDFGREVVGRQFVFAQVLADDNDSTNTQDAYWDYDKASQTFRVDLRDYTSSFYVKFSSKKVGEYTGQNAFGVKVRIKGFTETEAKLMPVGASDFSRLTYSVKADPVEGRRLSKDVRLVVKGEIAIGEGGDVTSCEDDHAGATIDDPVEVYTYTCYVHAKVTSVSFFDSGRDRVLASWPATTPAED